MGIGKEKTQNHKEKFQDEIEKAVQSGQTAFFNWFNESGGDVETNFLKGECDFALHILLPCLDILKNPETKTVLEIGYGGGRLLLPASKLFKYAIGVDVHDQHTLVEQELQKRGQQNFTLITTNGETLPLENEKVDFVYSFIVLQHVERLSIFANYLKETFRILKKDGIAILYFGRLYTTSLNRYSKLLFLLDQLLEKLDPRDHKEILERVNAVNLKISLKLAKRLVKDVGFTILGHGVSTKLPKMKQYGGQYYLKLKK